MANQKVPPELLTAKAWILEKYLTLITHPLKDAAERLILVSDYACRHMPLMQTLLNQEKLYIYTRKEYMQLTKSLSLELPQNVYIKKMRELRHTEFIRLLLLEQAGITNTEQSIQAWSDCADALILHSLAYCQQQVSLRYGIPCDEEGKEVTLFVLAMGKLGGRELNYSSDIDLIFTFTKAGTSNGEEQISNQEYFTKVVQLFIQIMQNPTEDGFVFRVDLRLRPNGDSGSLVSSLTAMETYYQEQGRDWERYAMLKARVIEPILGTLPLWFTQLITPFVYKRYIDFSVIESLRSMKAMIEREVQLNPRLNDMKRGRGGIREIEFIIQCIQLTRGGRIPTLRQCSTLAALAELKKENLLQKGAALRKAYLFLRALENAVQSHNDQQTHSLPADSLKRAQLTLAMGYEHWDSLVEQLNQYQSIVSHSFRQVLTSADCDTDEQKMLINQLNSIWQGHIEPSMAVSLLVGLGFDNSEQCYQMLHTFRHGSRCRRLSQVARLRLDKLIVMVLRELTQMKKTDLVLLNLIKLLEHIVGRSPYIALLTENKQALDELLHWCSSSPFIIDLLISQPFLLEVLLEHQPNWRPNSREQLDVLLKKQFMICPDLESKEELLRQFKLTYWLMAARAEAFGQVSAVRISQFLADLAEVIVNKVLDLACEQLVLRYPELSGIKERFAVVAYGKLGSREMNYNSDLDLVFLYFAESSEEALVTRLTQKMMHMLTTRSQSGVLFSVDTRLRPSGSAGLLVSPLNSFIEYQKKQAWTWEHQALLRARVISGSTRIKKQFLQLKKTILTLQRDSNKLAEDVLQMRTKIDQYHALDPIKHTAGGLLDLEFLVHYLVLKAGLSSLARFTHTLSLLKQLSQAKLLNQEHYLVLKKAYSVYHKALHQQVVCPGSCSTLSTLQEQVVLVYKELLGSLK
jgi:glutamate-ammonia-ligase adenylyltransferase